MPSLFHFFDRCSACDFAFGCALLIISMALCAVLCKLLRPLLLDLALAKPNDRSLHKIPTPQGAGIAVLTTGFLIGALADLALLIVSQASSTLVEIKQIAFLMLASVLLAIIGFIDDMRPLPAWPRLLTQAIAAGLGVLSLQTLPSIFGVMLPAALTLAVLILALIWFINLCNFMDGMDLMSIVELAPLFLLLTILLWPTHAALALLCLALCGALLGFMPFNWPVAKMFLGDVGSLPLGLLAGIGLVILMGETSLATALIAPLYYLVDASYTLMRRLLKRETIFEAHRQHFYQRAIDYGWQVPAIIGHVLRLNLCLCALCALSLRTVANLLHVPDRLLPIWPWLILAVAFAGVKRSLFMLIAPPPN